MEKRKLFWVGTALMLLILAGAITYFVIEIQNNAIYVYKPLDPSIYQNATVSYIPNVSNGNTYSITS